MAPRRPAVLFDLDGTLVDTTYLHTIAWSRAFRAHDHDVAMNAIHRLIGMGGEQMVDRLIGHADERVGRERTEQYRELLHEARPLRRAGDLLAALMERGVAVVIATSSPDDEVEVLLDLVGGPGAVTAVTTADDVRAPKPAPDAFLAAMRAVGAEPQSCVGVGDAVWDVESARSAGLGLIGVETGGFSHHELSEAGALHVYRDVGELLDQLSVSPIAHLLDR